MGNPLLDRASPRELADRAQVIDKQEKLGTFPRLAEAVADDLGSLAGERVPASWQRAPVAIRLTFGWLDDRRQVPAVTGRVSACIAAVCQRCLEPLELPLSVEFRLLLGESGGPAAEAEGYETWEIDGPLVRPLDIVDESLIMAMPLSAMHAPSEECTPAACMPAGDGSDRVRPFADLRKKMLHRD